MLIILCLFTTLTQTFIKIDSSYTLAFSCTFNLNAKVLSSEHFYRSKTEVFISPNTCVDAEGNIYLGIEDLNDASAFYLNLLYRNNKNVSLKRVRDGDDYRNGIYLNRPVTLEELADCFQIISSGSDLASCSIEVIFPSPNKSDWLELYNTNPNFSLSTGGYNWVNIVPKDSNSDNIKVRGYLILISLPGNIVKDEHKD